MQWNRIGAGDRPRARGLTETPAAVRSRLTSLWRNLVHRQRVDRELDDELRPRSTWSGRVPAGRAFRRTPPSAPPRGLGPLRSIQRQVRDARAGALLETLLQDVRHGLRRLRRDPLFTTFAALLSWRSASAPTPRSSACVHAVLYFSLPACTGPSSS